MAKAKSEKKKSMPSLEAAKLLAAQPPKSLKRQIRNLLGVLSSPEKAHDVWAALLSYLPNPDKILETAGADENVRFYDSMVDSDSHLAGLINTRMDAVTGLDWEIIPASEEDKDVEIADFVRDQFLNIFEFENDLEELMGAVRTGYSVSEIVWERQDSKIGVVALLSRRPERFRFDNDYQLRLRTKDNWHIGEPVPPNKFIVHRNRMRYEGPYGVSACRAAYWAWRFKHEGFQWWIVAAERNAVPTPVGAYPAGWDADQQNDFMNRLVGFQNDNAIIYEIGAEINMIATKTDPQLNEKLRDACNEEMAWAIIGSTHATGTGAKGGGSYALAREHGTVRQDILERDSKRLMSTINNQLVTPLVLFNYFEPENGYPRFRLMCEPPADRKLETEITEKAVKMGIEVDERIATEKMGIKVAEDGAKAIEGPTTGFGNDEFPAGELSEKKSYPVTIELASAAEKEGNRNVKIMDKLGDAAVEYGTPAMEKTADQFKDWLKTQATLESALGNLNYFSFSPDPLASNLTDINFWNLLWGYHEVFRDKRITKNLSRQTKNIFGLKRTVELPIQLQSAQYKPLRPDEAIKLFEKRKVLDREQFDLLLDYARQESFTAAGITLDTLDKKLKPAMIEALSEGQTLSQFTKAVDDILVTPGHIEVVYRTNMIAAYNQGHTDAYFDPLVADSIPAIQFIAVIDDRTTDICESLDGQIFLKGDALGAQLTPPLHYQCRSTTVPVFSDEFAKVSGDKVFDPSVMSRWPEKAQPLPGFGYFRPVVNKV